MCCCRAYGVVVQPALYSSHFRSTYLPAGLPLLPPLHALSPAPASPPPTRYEDEVLEDLKKRTGGKEDQLTKVGLRKYSSVSPRAFGLQKGKKRVAVVRAGGAIVGEWPRCMLGWVHGCRAQQLQLPVRPVYAAAAQHSSTLHGLQGAGQNEHAAPLLRACCAPAVPLPRPCRAPAVPLLCPCCAPAVPLLHPLQSTPAAAAAT
jgi:hypothetical protein